VSTAPYIPLFDATKETKDSLSLPTPTLCPSSALVWVFALVSSLQF